MPTLHPQRQPSRMTLHRWRVLELTSLAWQTSLHQQTPSWQQRELSARERRRTAASLTETELVDVVDTLERAISVIQREMAKNLPWNTDTRNMNNVVSALTAVIDATAFSSAEKQKLVALVQNRQASDDDDSELSAPAAAAYVSHSSDIVDLLNDLMDKVPDSIGRNTPNVAHNLALLRQALEDQLTQDDKALTKAKAVNSEFASSLEAERADFGEAEKSLAAVLASEAASKNSCAQVAADREVSVKGFSEEFKALADATQVLRSETGAAELFHWCAHDGGPQRVRCGDDGEAFRPKGALCCSLSVRLPYLCCHEVWCGCW